MDRNWEGVILKMRRYCGFWWNFGLSISGRVMVIKTYVISQAIYVMGVLMMREEYGRRMNEIMIDFVKGGDRTIEARRRNWEGMALLT